jgi:hypothetical protein
VSSNAKIYLRYMAYLHVCRCTTIISSIVAVISAIKAYFDKREAKKSEEVAKESARLASKYYVAAKEYYDKMNQELEISKKRREETDLKDEVYKLICTSGLAKIDTIVNKLGISKDKAYEILIELLQIDRVINCGGSSRKENMDNAIWTQKL